MGALLDTHALIWWAEGDERITPRVRALLTSPDEVYVSAATGWEIATKLRIGKLRARGTLLHDFLVAVDAFGFRPLPISLRHGYAAGQIESAHRDPFDRMLAAQSLAENLQLVSADPAFATLGVAAFW
jgi:PIN domain nuclease of toxin-antitoxin system